MDPPRPHEYRLRHHLAAHSPAPSTLHAGRPAVASGHAGPLPLSHHRPFAGPVAVRAELAAPAVQRSESAPGWEPRCMWSAGVCMLEAAAVGGRGMGPRWRE